MPTLTLAQLLTIQSPQTIYQTLLSVYASFGFPVTAWQDGETEKTRLLAIATSLADISGNFNPQVAAGGFIDFATGQWLQLKSQEDFNLPFNAASTTVGQFVITQTSAVASAQTITPGKMTGVFVLGGNRYFLTGFMVAGVFTNAPQSLAFGSPLVGVFAAESPGSKYNDPSNSAITSSTPLPGVTLTNPAGSFSAVVHNGAGTGSLTLTGSPSGTHQVLVTITSTGASGFASWSYSIDGSPAVSAGSVSSLSNVGGTGVNITLTNGVSGTSFVNTDTYLFSMPGTWITTQGSDDEGDRSLAQRCRNRWSSLAAIPTSSLYTLLAQSTPSVGSQVTQVFVVPDKVVNNKANIVVAGPAGPLPAPTIALIQAFVSPYARLCDLPVVVSPSTAAITIAATITVSAQQLAAAQAAITTALNNYVAAIAVNGTIRIAAIIDVIMNVAGVIDCTSVTINGGSVNLALGSETTFVLPADPPTLTLSYVTQ